MGNFKNYDEQSVRVAEQYPEFSTNNGWKVAYVSEIISELSASTLTIVNELEKEELKAHYFPETGAAFIKNKFVRRSTSPEGYEFVFVTKEEVRHMLLIKK